MADRTAGGHDAIPAGESSNWETEGAIKPQAWAVMGSGAKVFASDGEQVGTVREATLEYLVLKQPDTALADTEIYVPRDLVDRVADDEVHLRVAKADMDAMDLKTPPGMRNLRP